MKNEKKRGNILIISGLLLLAMAICLTGYNLVSGELAAERTEQILETLTMNVPEPLESPDYLYDEDVEMPVIFIDGKAYIGILNIPALGLKLPVLSEWSYPNLRFAPCRYDGSVYKNDMIICAHNFPCHFGRLKYLSIGTELTFIDMDGNFFLFEVSGVEILQPTATAKMKSGEGDLTLFTCTVGGQNRVTIRCLRR